MKKVDARQFVSEAEAVGDIGYLIHQDFLRWLRALQDALPERLRATPVLTADYTARVWDLLLVDATGGAFAVAFPSGPTDGTEIGFSEYGGSVNNVTLTPGTDDTIMGGAFLIRNTAAAGHTFIYCATLRDWTQLG